MQRSIINSSVLRCARPALKQNFRRNFTSSTQRTTSKTLSGWIVPSSIMAIGISTYYLTQPLQLDTKKDKTSKDDKVKESKSSEEVKPENAEKAAEVKQEGGEGEAQGEEGQQQAAYNPDTGEINWDCPCLGGMAHGPCGEEFKEAFSCFVFSEADPKGFDCIEKFKNMQNCFRKYPEVYSEEIRDEENAPVDTTQGESDVKNPEESTPVAGSETVANSSIAIEPIPSADVNPVVTEQVALTKEN